MSVIIGIDPHKVLHAACVIDSDEVQLAELTVRTGPRQIGQLLEWATPFEVRTWAIESAGGLGYLLVYANTLLDSTLLFAALFLLIVLGVVLFILVGVAERLILPWNHEARDG